MKKFELGTTMPDGGEPTGDKEFDDGFAEFSKEMSGDKKENPTQEDVKPGSDQKADDHGEGPAETVKTETDPWAGVDPALKSEFEKVSQKASDLEHRWRSETGRTGGLQKKINDLERNLQEALDSQKKGKAAVGAEEIKEAMKTPEAWESFKEEYPDIAEATDAITDFKINSRMSQELEKMRSEYNELVEKKFGSLEKTIQPVVEAEGDRRIERQYEILSAPKEEGGFGHSDFATIIESQEYKDWVVTLPEAVQELRKSEHAKDAAFILDLFKAAHGKTAVENSGKRADPVAEARARNEKRLKDGEALPSDSRINKGDGGAPAGDFESDFKFFAKKFEKQKDAAYR